MVESSDFDPDYRLRNKLLVAARERLAAARTLSDVVSAVISSARGVCSADGVTFVLRDGDQCHYVDEDAIGPLWKGRRFPMNTCISGWSMLNRKSAAIADVFADPRIPHDVYRATFVKSLIMSPVGVDLAVAAIGLYWAQPREFSPHDVSSAEDLAASVATALKFARAA